MPFERGERVPRLEVILPGQKLDPAVVALLRKSYSRFILTKLRCSPFSSPAK